MKTSKKLLSLLLVVLMVLSLLPTMAFAGDDNVAQINGTSYATLAEAFTAAQSGDTIKIIEAGEYEIPAKFENITLQGSVKSGEVVAILKDNLAYGQSAGQLNNVKFQNLTFKFSGNKYTGFQHSANVEFNGCTLEGAFNCYGKTKFENCTFDLTKQADYVWTYGSDVDFESCVFNTLGKAILCYNEGSGVNNVSVTDCTFNATTGDKAGVIANQNCAAIEIDNYGCGVNLTTLNNTVDTTEGKFSGEWRIKNYVAPDTDSVTVNGTVYKTIALDGVPMVKDAQNNVTVLPPVAQIGEDKYYTLAEAVEGATSGTENNPVVIELLKDIQIDNTVVINVANVTLDGNNKTITSGKDNIVMLQLATNDGIGKDGIVVKNLTLDGNGHTGVTCLKQFYGTHTCANVTMQNASNAVRWSYIKTGNTHTYDNCVFDCGIYGIHYDGSSTGNVVVTNSQISGFTTIAGTVKITFDGCCFVGGDKSAYAVCQTWGQMEINNSTFDDAWASKGDNCYVGTATENAVVIMNDVKMADGSTKELLSFVGADPKSYVVIDATKNADQKFTSGTFVGSKTIFDPLVAAGYVAKAVEGKTDVYVIADRLKTVDSLTFVYGDENKSISAESNAGTLSYAVTSGNDVVEVNDSTGALTIKKAGTATATVTVAAVEGYAEYVKEISITVIKASQSAPAKGEGYDVSAQGVITAETGYELKTEGTSYFVRKAEKDNYFASPYTAIDTTVSINVVASPANMGTVTGGGTYTIGESVTVTAMANEGYKFVKWMDKDAQASTDAAYTFTATAGRTLIAVFEPETEKTVVQIPVANNKTYGNTSITGVASGSGYTLSGTASATDAGTYTATATLDNADTFVWADGTTAPKTITWVIYKATQIAPAGVVGGENSITGVNNTMEYMAKGGSGYIEIAENAINDLSAGTYYVRLAGDANHLASPAVVVTVSLPTITVTTIQPEVTGQNTAKLYGVVAPYDASRITEVGFEYRADSAGDWTKETVDTPAASFNKELTDLTAGTGYVVRAYVKTSDETMIYGAEKTFYTLAAEAAGKIDIFIDNPQHKGVTITVEEGNNVLASVALSGDNWTINHLENGFYNIVVRTTDGDFTETRLVEVVDGNAVASSFSIPVGKLATVVDVKTEETPAVAVDGLAEILTEDEKNAAAAGSVDVEVKLEVEAKAVETTETDIQAIQTVIDSGVAIATEETIETVLDLSLIKTTSELDENGEVASVNVQNIGSANNKVLEIAVPYEGATVGAAINVYRVHDGAAEKLVQLSNRLSGNFVDGTYFVGEGYIFIYASDFSTYAFSSVKEITEFTVTFNANGGFCNTSSAQTNVSRKLASLPTASRFGYSFVGWYTSVTGGEKITTDTVFTADTIVYAHWTMNYEPTLIIPVTPTYTITGADTENGKLTVSRKTASAGENVTITVTPDEGYRLDTLTVKDAKGNALTLTTVNDTTYTFKMPSSKVSISATFTEIEAEEPVDEPIETACPQDETCVYAKFTDADTKAWYHDGVHFCVENGYMQGVSATAFDPSGTTTRVMIVMMLWRMEGEPVVNYAMSFEDVKAGQWYTEAIRWAQATGVVEGYSTEKFGPDDPITREQMATILYRYAKYHRIDVANTNTLAGYTDVNKVSSWALDAMKWANAVGLVQGRTTTTLVPEVSITRAEAATMVQRYCEKVCKD